MALEELENETPVETEDEENLEESEEGSEEEQVEEQPELSEDQKLIQDLKARVDSQGNQMQSLREQLKLRRDMEAVASKSDEDIDLFPGMPDDYIPTKAELNAALKKINGNVNSKLESQRESNVISTMTSEHSDFNEVITKYLQEIISDPSVLRETGLEYDDGNELYQDLQRLNSIDPLKAARRAYRIGTLNPKYKKPALPKKNEAEKVIDKIAKNSKRPTTLGSGNVRSKGKVDNYWDLSDEEFEKEWNKGLNR